VPRRAERARTRVGWLNFGLETAYEWFALLRSNWDYHCCYQEKPQPDRYAFAGSLHNFILLLG
jgi:hypothetical protein